MLPERATPVAGLFIGLEREKGSDKQGITLNSSSPPKLIIALNQDAILLLGPDRGSPDSRNPRRPISNTLRVPLNRMPVVSMLREAPLSREATLSP